MKLHLRSPSRWTRRSATCGRRRGAAHRPGGGGPAWVSVAQPGRAVPDARSGGRAAGPGWIPRTPDDLLSKPGSRRHEVASAEPRPGQAISPGGDRARRLHLEQPLRGPDHRQPGGVYGGSSGRPHPTGDGDTDKPGFPVAAGGPHGLVHLPAGTRGRAPPPVSGQPAAGGPLRARLRLTPGAGAPWSPQSGRGGPHGAPERRSSKRSSTPRYDHPHRRHLLATAFPCGAC